ncbi:UNVERIFIED_ORG: hypothetical protein J2W85_002398 [Ensifer adhaerens]|nr:hypothetical protein [Ensifer adhaerens]
MNIFDLPAAMAIQIGRLYLKPRAVHDWLSRSCRMLICEQPDRSLPLYRRGSSTLIRFRSKNHVVFTRHQLDIPRGRDPDTSILETVRINSGHDRLANIPLQHCIFSTSHSDEEFHDLIVCEAADQWGRRLSDAPHFFPLEPFHDGERHFSWIVGYPHIDGVIDEYHETFEPGLPGQINIKRALMDCIFDPTFRSRARHYRRYAHSRPDAVMDGFSGGAVFSLVGSIEGLRVVLDGIVVRAGPHDIYVVDSDYLLFALETSATRATIG